MKGGFCQRTCRSWIPSASFLDLFFFLDCPVSGCLCPAPVPSFPLCCVVGPMQWSSAVSCHSHGAQEHGTWLGTLEKRGQRVINDAR